MSDDANLFRANIKKIFIPEESGKTRLGSSLLKIIPQAELLTTVLSQEKELTPIQGAMFAELGKRYNTALAAMATRSKSSFIDPYNLFMDAWDMAGLLYDFRRLTILTQNSTSAIGSEKTQALSKELDENGFNSQAKKSLYIGLAVTGVLFFAAALFPPIHPIISHHLLATTIAGSAAIISTTFVISKFSDKIIAGVRAAVGFITNERSKGDGKSILPRDQKVQQEHIVPASKEEQLAANNVVKNKPKTYDLAEMVEGQPELMKAAAKSGLKQRKGAEQKDVAQTGHVARLEQQRAPQNAARSGGKNETKLKRD